MEEKTEQTAKEPKAVYSYTVTRYDNGLYDFAGNPLESSDGKPSIDKLNTARDIIDLGRKLDHQLLVEEASERAKQEVFAQLQQLAQQQEEPKN